MSISSYCILTIIAFLVLLFHAIHVEEKRMGERRRQDIPVAVERRVRDRRRKPSPAAFLSWAGRSFKARWAKK